MTYNFRNMRIHGADRLSVLTMENSDQASRAMELYNATEGREFGAKLLPFIERYGGSEHGLLNFSGSIISLALSNKLLTPEQLAEAVEAINQKARAYEKGERFGYFAVPFQATMPKGRMIVRDPNYDRVVIARDMRDAETYARLVEAPARKIMEELLAISGRHGLERCVVTGPVVEDLLK